MGMKIADRKKCWLDKNTWLVGLGSELVTLIHLLVPSPQHCYYLWMIISWFRNSMMEIWSDCNPHCTTGTSRDSQLYIIFWDNLGKLPDLVLIFIDGLRGNVRSLPEFQSVSDTCLAHPHPTRYVDERSVNIWGQQRCYGSRTPIV